MRRVSVFGIIAVLLALIGLAADLSGLGLLPAEPNIRITVTHTPSQSTIKTDSIVGGDESQSSSEVERMFPMFIGARRTYHYFELFDIVEETIANEGQYEETVVFVESAFRDYSRVIGVDYSERPPYFGCPEQPTIKTEPDLWYVATDEHLFQVCSRGEANSIVRAIRESAELGQVPSFSDLPEYVFPLYEGALWDEFVDLPPREGTSYQWYVQVKTDVTVPAGRFVDCFKLVLWTGPEDIIKWVCPGVGLVAGEMHHHGPLRDYRFELIDWSIPEKQDGASTKSNNES